MTFVAPNQATAQTIDGPQLLERTELLRLDAARQLNAKHKAALGQYFTPSPLAAFMASMAEANAPTIHILDAGAGIGTLFAGCVAQLVGRELLPRRIEVTAYELDDALIGYLSQTLELCRRACEQAGIGFQGEVIGGDFIEHAARLVTGGDLFTYQAPRLFNLAVLNPPYKKIQTSSHARRLLRQIGVETSNLYAGFLAATIQLLAPGGELVAITPRSFCNGPYFKPFRRFLLKTTALRRLHVFESRQEAFRDDEVLQETVILHAVRQANKLESVLITTSSGPADSVPSYRVASYDEVVQPGDSQAFIHIVPSERDQQFRARMSAFHHTLPELGLSVSTGRVVDFRAREFLRPQPDDGTVPLIYPVHFEHGYILWPKAGSRKPNALLLAPETHAQVIPNAHYVLVKRFSAKEEQRRVAAAVFDAARVPGSVVGFENHLNYFHAKGQGLTLGLARGLAAFLNSTVVDAYFRQFNGNTQVNATDLRNIRYPTLRQLEAVGEHIGAEFPPQNEVDDLIEQELFSMAEEQGGGPVRAQRRVQEAMRVLSDLGFPRQQQNERSALTLLSLLDLTPDKAWSEAEQPLRGITQMMDFFRDYYGKTYAPNTRETVRRQTVHQFRDAGLVVINPDQPYRPTNSGQTVYRVDDSALELLRTFDTSEWDTSLRTYLASVETLASRYAQVRQMARIPIKINEDSEIALSPSGQNVLVKHIIDDFAPYFTPGGKLLYVGDTDEKFAHMDADGLRELGITIEAHGKMPDVNIHHTAENWLVLVEVVTSHGPVNPKRRAELKHLFADSTAGLVFVTAFLDRRTMMHYLNDISWETEVWVADAPTHLIHFNGVRFLGPYESAGPHS